MDIPAKLVGTVYFGKSCNIALTDHKWDGAALDQVELAQQAGQHPLAGTIKALAAEMLPGIVSRNSNRKLSHITIKYSS